MESSSSLLPWRSAVLPPIFLYSYSVTFYYLQFFLIYFGQGRVTMFPYEIYLFIWQWKQRVTEKLEGGGGKALLPCQTAHGRLLTPWAKLAPHR